MLIERVRIWFVPFLEAAEANVFVLELADSSPAIMSSPCTVTTGSPNLRDQAATFLRLAAISTTDVMKPASNFVPNVLPTTDVSTTADCVYLLESKKHTHGDHEQEPRPSSSGKCDSRGITSKVTRVMTCEGKPHYGT